jgi:hypothetical protein
MQDICILQYMHATSLRPETDRFPYIRLFIWIEGLDSSTLNFNNISKRYNFYCLEFANRAPESDELPSNRVPKHSVYKINIEKQGRQYRQINTKSVPFHFCRRSLLWLTTVIWSFVFL